MSGYIKSEVRNVNPYSRDEQIGPWIRKGLKITPAFLDVELPWFFKFIWATIPGDVTYENQEGELVVVESFPARFLWPGIGRKILSAGTTAGGITVYGSE